MLEYPIPQLDDPRAFDEWRVNVARASAETFNATVDVLIELNDPLANLRAAIMLTSSDSEQSRELASKALKGRFYPCDLLSR